MVQSMVDSRACFGADKIRLSLHPALWELFCHIDKDKDMQLTAEELQNALSRAG